MSPVKLIPKGSQVAILGLFILLGISLDYTIDFYLQDIPIWLPLSFSALLFITICIFWFVSHRQVDNNIKQSPEITVSEGNRSTNIILPQGTVSSNALLELFQNAITSTLYRKELPVPDGLVDETGAPIQQSQEEAREIVQTINNQLQELQQRVDLSDSESFSSEQQQLISQPIVSEDPQLDNDQEINQIEDNSDSSA